MKNIYRQVHIDLITDTPNEIITWINNLLCDLHVIETNVYHCNGNEFIYYIKNEFVNNFVFYMDVTHNLFSCDYTFFWRELEIKTKTETNYINTQKIAKLLIENNLNIQIGNPSYPFDRHYILKALESL